MRFKQNVEQMLGNALAMLVQINRKVDKLMATEQDLLKQIAGLKQSQTDEANNLDTLSKALDALIAKLQSANIPDADIAAFQAIKDGIDTSNAALLAAAQKASAA